MPDKKAVPYRGMYRPEYFQRDQHRPDGVPHPRENRSQQAQLQSVHQHGTRKDVKTTRNNITH